MDLTTDLSGIRRPVNRATHVPGHFYASEDIYALEKEKIFMRDWMLVAREEELEKPGNYLIITLRLLGEPIVVTRNQAGQLNAFANVCAHRGDGERHHRGVFVPLSWLALRSKRPPGRRALPRESRARSQPHGLHHRQSECEKR